MSMRDEYISFVRATLQDTWSKVAEQERAIESIERMAEDIGASDHLARLAEKKAALSRTRAWAGELDAIMQKMEQAQALSTEDVKFLKKIVG